MDVSFFIFFTPWSIWYVINRVYQETPSLTSPLLSASLNLFQSISFSIAYLNNLSSFFLIYRLIMCLEVNYLRLLM